MFIIVLCEIACNKNVHRLYLHQHARKIEYMSRDKNTVVSKSEMLLN